MDNSYNEFLKKVESIKSDYDKSLEEHQKEKDFYEIVVKYLQTKDINDLMVLLESDYDQFLGDLKSQLNIVKYFILNDKMFLSQFKDLINEINKNPIFISAIAKYKQATKKVEEIKKRNSLLTNMINGEFFDMYMVKVILDSMDINEEEKISILLKITLETCPPRPKKEEVQDETYDNEELIEPVTIVKNPMFDDIKVGLIETYKALEERINALKARAFMLINKYKDYSLNHFLNYSEDELRGNFDSLIAIYPDLDLDEVSIVKSINAIDEKLESTTKFIDSAETLSEINDIKMYLEEIKKTLSKTEAYYDYYKEKENKDSKSSPEKTVIYLVDSNNFVPFFNTTGFNTDEIKSFQKLEEKIKNGKTGNARYIKGIENGLSAYELDGENVALSYVELANDIVLIIIGDKSKNIFMNTIRIVNSNYDYIKELQLFSEEKDNEELKTLAKIHDKVYNENFSSGSRV